MLFSSPGEKFNLNIQMQDISMTREKEFSRFMARLESRSGQHAVCEAINKAFHALCESDEFSFSLLKRQDSNPLHTAKTGNMSDAAEYYHSLKKLTGERKPKLNTEYPINNTMKASMGYKVDDSIEPFRNPAKKHLSKSNIDYVMAESDKNGWGLEFDEDTPILSRYGDYTGMVGEGFSYTRCVSSYETGPDQNFAEDILKFLEPLGYTYTVDTPERDERMTSQYETYYFVYKPSVHSIR